MNKTEKQLPSKQSALLENMLTQAKALGATSAEVDATQSLGFDATVRMGEVDTVEHHASKGVAVTVYFGQCKGTASTTDTNPDSVKKTIEAACHIARFTQADEYAGLADKNKMAYDYPKLELSFPWALSVAEAISMGLECEQLARAHDKRINNSEGVTVGSYQTHYAYANSHGFLGEYQTTRHNITCAVVATENNQMERDYSYTVARDAKDLLSIEQIAREAADNTVKRLGSKRIPTQKVPVVFAPRVARGVIGHFLSAIKGTSQYRKSSFLFDHLGKRVLPEWVSVVDDPFLPKGLGSVPFDGEGVKVEKRCIVSDGILNSYVLSSYSARKLGLETTGNAGGTHNIFVSHHDNNLASILRNMGKGLLVTELMGQGVNIVTGDYSRGASGYWVENGEIQYPVSEITIAGNLKTMLEQIVTIGNDDDNTSSLHCGSLLIDNMMLAGE